MGLRQGRCRVLTTGLAGNSLKVLKYLKFFPLSPLLIVTALFQALRICSPRLFQMPLKGSLNSLGAIRFPQSTRVTFLNPNVALSLA